MAHANDTHWLPATFVERGVAVPFTTPVLAGTRARLAPAGLEFIVPHPAGARGVYIMVGGELAHFCAATLHDTMLVEKLAALRAITPATMRASARAVAASGAAGRRAAVAARQAEAAERQNDLLSNIHLLQCLVAHTSGGHCAPAELDRHAKAAILRLAPALGRAPAAITHDIEALAALYAQIGTTRGAAEAPCARLVEDMQTMLVELDLVAQTCPGRTALAVGLLAQAAKTTLLLARHCLQVAHERLSDLSGLLGAWGSSPAATAELLARPQWVLDGWQQICLVWQLSNDSTWRGAVGEMALMLPPVPRQASEWMGTKLDEQDGQLRKLVQGQEDWRTGHVVLDLIARNEHIRALAA